MILSGECREILLMLLYHILEGSCLALFTMKNSKMLQGERLYKHPEREASFQILLGFWSLLRVTIRVVHVHVLSSEFPQEGRTHRMF